MSMGALLVQCKQASLELGDAFLESLDTFVKFFRISQNESA